MSFFQLPGLVKRDFFHWRQTQPGPRESLGHYTGLWHGILLELNSNIVVWDEERMKDVRLLSNLCLVGFILNVQLTVGLLYRETENITAQLTRFTLSHSLYHNMTDRARCAAMSITFLALFWASITQFFFELRATYLPVWMGYLPSCQQWCSLNAGAM